MAPRSALALHLEAMQRLRARVENSRLALDEPTDLPEGDVVELVPADELARGGDYLDDDDRAELHRPIEDGIEDVQKGDTEDALEFPARLRSLREGPDRQATSRTGRTSK